MHGRQRTDIANTSIYLQKTNVQCAREQYVVLKLVGAEHLSVNPANPWLEEPTSTCLITRQPFAANSKCFLVTDSHKGTVLSSQLGVEPGLAISGRRVCGTAIRYLSHHKEPTFRVKISFEDARNYVDSQHAESDKT